MPGNVAYGFLGIREILLQRSRHIYKEFTLSEAGFPTNRLRARDPLMLQLLVILDNLSLSDGSRCAHRLVAPHLERNAFFTLR